MNCIIFNYSVEYVLYDTDIFIMYTFLDDTSHKTIKNRVVTPHALKTTKVNQNKVIRSQNNPISSSTTNHTGNKINLKRTIKAQTEKKETINKKFVDEQDGKSSIRRSSRLANKPSKNYKC